MKILKPLLLASLSIASARLFAADSAATSSTPPPAATPAEALALGFGPTIAADATVTKLGSGYGFTEGATTNAKGDVFFVDQNNNRIHKWSVADNTISIFLEPSGRSNGQYFDAKGNLLACADEKNELWSITPDGQHTVLISSAGFEGKPLDGPNDVWVRPDGGIYITDPHYGRAWWDKSVTRPAQEIRSVYYLAPGAKTLKRVAQDFKMPNGIAGTPDGKTLFVADINDSKIYGYDIQADGSLLNRRLVCNYGSDGMTIDNQGNLYLSANIRGARPPGGTPPAAGATPATPPARGVSIVEIKSGKLIGFVPVPEQPANMAFGGKNHDQLFITARTGFYMIPTKVKGANPAK